jgi:hypothetical protein
MSEDMILGMMLGQRVRDTVMARSLVQNKKDKSHDSIVLIAGSGHVVKHQGVPVHLVQMDKQAKILSLAWMEVSQEHDDPEQYGQFWQNTSLPFDYVWFTPRIERADPCEEIRKHKLKKEKDQETSPPPEQQQVLLSEVSPTL